MCWALQGRKTRSELPSPPSGQVLFILGPALSGVGLLCADAALTAKDTEWNRMAMGAGLQKLPPVGGHIDNKQEPRRLRQAESVLQDLGNDGGQRSRVTFLGERWGRGQGQGPCLAQPQLCH